MSELHECPACDGEHYGCPLCAVAAAPTWRGCFGEDLPAWPLDAHPSVNGEVGACRCGGPVVWDQPDGVVVHRPDLHRGGCDRRPPDPADIFEAVERAGVLADQLGVHPEPAVPFGNPPPSLGRGAADWTHCDACGSALRGTRRGPIVQFLSDRWHAYCPRDCVAVRLPSSRFEEEARATYRTAEGRRIGEALREVVSEALHISMMARDLRVRLGRCTCDSGRDPYCYHHGCPDCGGLGGCGGPYCSEPEQCPACGALDAEVRGYDGEILGYRFDCDADCELANAGQVSAHDRSEPFRGWAAGR